MDGKSSLSVADSAQIVGGQMQSPRLTVSVPNGNGNNDSNSVAQHAGITPKHTSDLSGKDGVEMPGGNGDTNLNGETATLLPIMKAVNANNTNNDNDNSTISSNVSSNIKSRPSLLKTTSSFTKRGSVNKSSRKIHFSDQVGGKLEENVFCSNLHYSSHEVVRTNEVASTSCCTIS